MPTTQTNSVYLIFGVRQTHAAAPDSYVLASVGQYHNMCRTEQGIVATGHCYVNFDDQIPLAVLVVSASDKPREWS